MHLGTLGLPPTSIEHIAYVVADLGKTVEHFRDNLGLGPWTPPGVADVSQLEIGVPYKVKFTTTMVGGVGMDVIEPLEDDPIFGKFVKDTGGGLHHVAFAPGWCSEEARQKLGAQPGVEVVQRGSYLGKVWEYFTRSDLPNIVVEIVDPGEHIPVYQTIKSPE